MADHGGGHGGGHGGSSHGGSSKKSSHGGGAEHGKKSGGHGGGGGGGSGGVVGIIAMVLIIGVVAGGGIQAIGAGANAIRDWWQHGRSAECASYEVTSSTDTLGLQTHSDTRMSLVLQRCEPSETIWIPVGHRCVAVSSAPYTVSLPDGTMRPSESLEGGCIITDLVFRLQGSTPNQAMGLKVYKSP